MACGTSAQMPHKWAYMAVQAADVLLFETPRFSKRKSVFLQPLLQNWFEFGFSSPTKTSHDWATLPMSHNSAVFGGCIA